MSGAGENWRRCDRQETGDRRQETGDRKQETGNRKQKGPQAFAAGLTLSPDSCFLSPVSYFFTASSRPLYRAAALRWMRPFRAERSSNWIARFLSEGEAPAVLAFFRAVRSEDRWARLRAAAATDFRWCLAADAILGKE